MEEKISTSKRISMVKKMEDGMDMSESMDYENGKNGTNKSNKSSKFNKSNRNLPVAINLNNTTDHYYNKTLNVKLNNTLNHNTSNDHANSLLEPIPFHF
jgi:hypothetical protein